MIPKIKELNFPKYATLESATVTLGDMGERTIAADISIDGGITPDFSYDWEVEYGGETYIMPLREPQASKDNASPDSQISLTFQHWAQYQLKRWYFFTVQPVESGTAAPDKYIASVSLTLPNFINLFNQVLAYYYGDKIKIQLNPDYIASEEPTTVEINHSYIWDVLLKLYELYAVRWTIEADPADEGCYVIKVGYDAVDVSHVFEYGFKGGLLKVERQVQDENIRNMLIGRGGEKNLPYRYYKDVDYNNNSFPADPDWIPELANIHFDVLRGATFRSYIQGWKAKHYGGKTSKANAYAPWAWDKGYTDAKFNPVEYVKDDESIAKYGPLMGGFDNNEEFYPTIQGVNSADHLNFFGEDFGRVDRSVAVTKIHEAENKIVKPNDSSVSTLAGVTATYSFTSKQRKTITLQGGSFTVPAGKRGDLVVSVKVLTNADKITVEGVDVQVFKNGSSAAISASGIPAGDYTYKILVDLYNTTDSYVSANVGDNAPKLTVATPGEELNGTFDIWIKNIWGTAKSSAETDKEYVERVWLPILGGSDGSEAKIVFSTGWLSTSEDYEFMIVRGGINYDTSKTLDGAQSHWRLTLARCDAEYEATGKYIPNAEFNANDGDYFFFTGIDMPNAYTVWAEERLDNWKKDQLLQVANIKSTWVVQTDRVRLNNEGHPGAIIDEIRPGRSITLRDKRFIPDPSHQVELYIQSVTCKYRKPSSTDNALNPDVEMTLGTEYAATGNVVAQLQGEVSALQKQVGSISNVAGLIETIGNKKYLRKDRPDKTFYELVMAGGAEFGNFLSGMLSGRGAAIDPQGNAEVETLKVRGSMQIMELIINRLQALEGDQIFTENDTVETAVAIGFSSSNTRMYRLKLREKYEGYKTAISERSVLRGIVNDIESGGSAYYNCWMLVNSVDRDTNTIEVSMYADADCPGGTNGSPRDLMTMARWGHQTDRTRQRLFYLSSSEGRIVRLEGVTKPILTDANFASVFGKLPEFLESELPAGATSDEGIYTKTLVAQNIYHVDYLGQPIPTVRDRGLWQSNGDYYDGTVKREATGDYEISDVWHGGCRWRCCISGTKAEPVDGSTAWAYMEGVREVDRLIVTPNVIKRTCTKPVQIVGQQSAQLPTYSYSPAVDVMLVHRESPDNVQEIPPSATDKYFFDAYARRASGTGATSLSISSSGRITMPDGIVAYDSIVVTQYDAELGNIVNTASVAIVADGEDGAEGPEGPEGEPGERGSRGIYIPNPMPWESYPSGYIFQAGGTNDERLDIVLDTNSDGREFYYQCTSRHIKSTSYRPNASSAKWSAGQQWDFIATKLLLADRGRINNLFVDDIEIVDNGGTTLAEMNKDRIFVRGDIMAGDPSGKRVHLDPEQKQIAIYDESGNLCTSLDGKNVTDPLPKDANISCKVSTTTTNFVSTKLGSEKKEQLILTSAGYSDISISGSVVEITPPQLTLRGTLYQVSPNFTSTRGTIKAYLVLQRKLAASLYTDVKSLLLGSAEAISGQSANNIIASKKYSFNLPTASDTYRFMLRLEYDSINGSATWGSATGFSVAVKADRFLSTHFANGMVMSRNLQNYFAVYADTNNCMQIKTGSSDGSGSYINGVKQPMTLWAGYISSTTTVNRTITGLSGASAQRITISSTPVMQVTVPVGTPNLDASKMLALVTPNGGTTSTDGTWLGFCAMQEYSKTVSGSNVTMNFTSGNGSSRGYCGFYLQLLYF